MVRVGLAGHRRGAGGDPPVAGALRVWKVSGNSLGSSRKLEHPRILGAMQSAAAHHRGPQNAGILEVLVVFRGPPAHTG